MGIFGGGYSYPPDMGPQEGVGILPGHRTWGGESSGGVLTQWDTVGKRAVRILLECCLVNIIIQIPRIDA